MGMIMMGFKIDVEEHMEIVRVLVENYMYLIEELINSLM